MSNPGDYGQNPAGGPQWGAPQQGYNPNQTQGFDPNQTQGFDPNQTQGLGQGYPQYGQQPQQPYGQPQQQWGGQPGYGAPAPQKKPLPYTIREFILMGVGLLILVFSFFPLASSSFFTVSLWSIGFWLPLVLLPFAASALIAARPFLPLVNRIGSLSTDQFASVVYSSAMVVWAALGLGIGSLAGGGFGSWVVWVLVLLTIAGIVLTVGAPFIPGLREEFDQRPEETAPRAGRTTRVIPEGKGVTLPAGAPVAQQTQPNTWGQTPAAAPVAQENPGAAQQQVPAPAQENPWAAQQQVPAPAQENPWATPVAAEDAPVEVAPVAADVPAEAAPAAEVAQEEAEAAPAEATPVEATPAEAAPAEAAPAAQQPFWALVPEERPVVDGSGAEIFRVGPIAWALVVEDNGSSFVIRHDDGRTGTLTDVSGVVRN